MIFASTRQSRYSAKQEAEATTLAYVDPDTTGKASPVVTIAASGVTVQNVTIAGGAGTSGDGIVADTVANVTLNNVLSHNNAQNGFRGADLSGVTTITQSSFNDNAADGLNLDGDDQDGSRLVIQTNSEALRNDDDGLDAQQFRDDTSAAEDAIQISTSQFNDNDDDTGGGDGIETERCRLCHIRHRNGYWQ